MQLHICNLLENCLLLLAAVNVLLVVCSIQKEFACFYGF